MEVAEKTAVMFSRFFAFRLTNFLTHSAEIVLDSFLRRRHQQAIASHIRIWPSPLPRPQLREIPLKVEERVANVYQSGKGNVFLNMGGHYPNQVFTAFVPASSASNVPNPSQYEGKTVSVKGKVVSHKGKPEIVVTSASQLKIEH